MRYTNGRCRIRVADGKHYLAMPDGTEIPFQISCKVKTRVNEGTYAVVKLQVNLDDTYMTETGERFPAKEMAEMFKPYDNTKQ